MMSRHTPKPPNYHPRMFRRFQRLQGNASDGRRHALEPRELLEPLDWLEPLEPRLTVPGGFAAGQRGKTAPILEPLELFAVPGYTWRARALAWASLRPLLDPPPVCPGAILRPAQRQLGLPAIPFALMAEHQPAQSPGGPLAAIERRGKRVGQLPVDARVVEDLPRGAALVAVPRPEHVKEDRHLGVVLVLPDDLVAVGQEALDLVEAESAADRPGPGRVAAHDIPLVPFGAAQLPGADEDQQVIEHL